MTEVPITKNPSDLVRPMHALLAHELGLPSPLAPAVKMLDRAAALSFNRTAGLASAQAARHALARAVALGEREFDEDSVREYDAGAIWGTGGPHPGIPASVQLADDVLAQARLHAAQELAKHAGGIFDTLATEAAWLVGVLEALPPPPRGLFGGGDPATLLTRAPGHESTYSTVLGTSDRFWIVSRGADQVRTAAGHGIERFPDGAPRLAGTYKNWRVALEKVDSELKITPRHFRLWRTVLDGWQPGVWRPEDIETTAADRSFGAKLRNLGSAVGVPWSLPAESAGSA